MTVRLSHTLVAKFSPNGWIGAKRTTTADDLLNHRVGFYGEVHQLSPVIDWDSNPGTAHWGHDLNRFFILEPLQNAFLETGDERYARKGLEFILSWIEQTGTSPVDQTQYTYKSYLNVAIRLENWGVFLTAIDQAAPQLLSDGDFAIIQKSVNFQIEHLDRVIPKAVNNWVIIGCRGILATLALFPFTPKQTEYCERAWSRIDTALENQLLPDGIQDELTPHYHYTVLKCVLQALATGPHVPTPPAERFIQNAARMIQFLRQTLTPDRLQIAFNDSDPDCASGLQGLLDSPIARSLTAKNRETLGSELFSYGGVAILREGSQLGREECYLAFDAGPFGTSHQHEDMLGFWLTAYGRSFIVDPGRHMYDRSPISLWPYLVTTQAHSTILIDGQGQNARASRGIPNAWRATAPLPILWKTSPNGSAVAGGTYTWGYGESLIPVQHSRLILFHADLKAWSIIDRVTGGGEHSIESRFQFAPAELTVRGTSNTGLSINTNFSDANLLLQTRPGDFTSQGIISGQRNPDGGWYSHGINQIVPSPTLLLGTGSHSLPWSSIIALVPYKGAAADPCIADKCIRRAEDQNDSLFAELDKLRNC